MQKQKILIFKIWAIGDVLMTTPFIKQLWESKKFEIDYMCWNWVAQILVWNEYIKNVINFDEKFFQKITIKNLFSYLKFLVFLFKKRKNYDYVVILDKHKVFNFTFFIAWFKNRYWFNRLWKEWKFLNKTIYWNKTKREVEYYLDFLELFWIKFDYKKQRYDFFWWIIDKLNKNKKLTEKEKSLIGRYLSKKQEIDKFIKQFTWKKIIWIATWWGNLLVPKNDCRWWNLENWKKLTIELLEKWNTVLLLWSKSDRNLNINNLNFYNLLWKYSIHEIIYLTSKIDLVISQEAGFIHFVWCINTKLLTIAWPTNPYRFHPYNDNWEKIKIGWIWKEEFECYDEYGSFDKCRWDEINKISVKEVLEKI
jgi:ADP-heptose:LPS heptosyltransferase